MIYKIDDILQTKYKVQNSELCDYSDAYIVVKGSVSVTGTNNVITKKHYLQE